MARPEFMPPVFESPGGQSPGARINRPIDLAHLSRQTMGDRALEQEVLGLFLQQATMVRDAIMDAGPVERLRLAHNLKGSARGVGAFQIADCVAEFERRPQDRQVIKSLSALIDDVRDFVAAIGR